MDTWRLLDTPPMTAAENMALDETLLELKNRGHSPNTIRFLQFSPRSVLVGYHQSVPEEIRERYCLENGIEINRRNTGGGAIFFDENQLGWEIICDKAFFNVNIATQRLFKTLCNPVLTALSRFGIKADFRPRNDIEVEGRKISGTGGTDSKNAFLFQGTMLVDFDVQTMLRALRIPVEKLKAKEIDSVKDRVTCLNWILGYTPSLEDIKSAIRHGFETGLNIQLVPGEMTFEEHLTFKKKLPYYQSDQWIHAVNPVFQKREAVQSAYKADAGMVRFTLVVNLPQKRLKDIYITGDFLSFPSRALFDLEASLRGSPLDRKHLHGIIRAFFHEEKITIPGMDFEDFVTPLDQALEKIEIAKFGLTLKHCNQISVANGSFETVIQKRPSVLLLPYCAKRTDCELRYRKTCKICGEEGCTIGPAWAMGLRDRMKVVSIISFEDLWAELEKMKKRGVKAYIGCCCQPFFAKHVDDFRKSGLPGILLNIDNTTCYDLDQAREAYTGKFESQTRVDLDLLETVLNAASP
ncbi:MAG: lipoate--protein ligase family protein [Deltaproteobacteria bacterium]|nr:lipoate--protein ligase family protein [Deltaproteobacteria bacterium]